MWNEIGFKVVRGPCEVAFLNQKAFITMDMARL